MMKPAVESSLDVAWWFMNRANAVGGPLPAYKIHLLLYLAQGSYAALHHGRMLMANQFIIHNDLPVDSAIHRLMDLGVWTAQEPRIPTPIDSFLDRVWARYDPLPVEFLRRKVERHAIIITATQEGNGTLLEFAKISQFFMNPGSGDADLIKANDGTVVEKWVPSNAKKLPR